MYTFDPIEKQICAGNIRDIMASCNDESWK
jgi:hypothetical protein